MPGPPAYRSSSALTCSQGIGSPGSSMAASASAASSASSAARRASMNDSGTMAATRSPRMVRWVMTPRRARSTACSMAGLLTGTSCTGSLMDSVYAPAVPTPRHLPGRLREAGISPRWGGCQWVAFLHLRAYLWRGAPDPGTLLTWRDGRAHRDHGLRTSRVDAGPHPRGPRRQHRGHRQGPRRVPQAAVVLQGRQDYRHRL